MDLDRIAVALALTRFMPNLPYSSWITTDFDFPNDVAKRDPSVLLLLLLFFFLLL